MAPVTSWGFPLLLALATALVFLPTLENDFVAWDDSKALYENPDYRGLGWPQLRWMFSTTLLGHYIPLTWLSFGLDYRMWGMNPAGYHLTNLLLHVVAVLLFYRLAVRLLERGSALTPGPARLGALTAGLFFAIHPLRVESVAWATERRDVLSGALFIGTILLYLAAVDASGSRRRRLLLASIGAFGLALAAKSIVMTLPAVLLVLDVYPLRRLPPDPRRWLRRSAWPVLIEKAPYAVLGLIGGLVGYYAQMAGARPLDTPWPSRLANVVYSLWFYLAKTALPVALSPLYEAPGRGSLAHPDVLVATLGLFGLGIALVVGRRWPPALPLAAFYVVVLAPVSGVIPLGAQWAADRYSYLAGLGCAVLMGGLVGTLAQRAGDGRLAPAVAGLAGTAVLVGFLVLGGLAWRQTHIWRDTVSLWTHSVAVRPDCGLCHRLLGISLIHRDEVATGVRHLEEARRLRPDRADIHVDLASAFERLGRWPRAVEEYRRAVAAYPDQPTLRHNLAVAMLRAGDGPGGLVELEATVRAAPDYAPARISLGLALRARGQPAEAVPHLLRALALEPASVPTRVGLIRAYTALGRPDLVREQEAALRRLHLEGAGRAAGDPVRSP
jgi:Flp pilus assembly protein TadD